MTATESRHPGTRTRAYLTPESDRARLDDLLWRGEITRRAAADGARRSPRPPRSRRRGIALASAACQGAEPRWRKSAGSNDPALAVRLGAGLRLANKDEEAHAMLLRVEPASARARSYRSAGGTKWRSRRAMPWRRAIPRLALELVRPCRLPAGDQYAEQQFLAGFIALRFLKDPARALPYFQQLDATVSRPISKSRADYWQGRAYEALGDTADAYAHYRLGRRLSRHLLRPARHRAHRGRAGPASERHRCRARRAQPKSKTTP